MATPELRDQSSLFVPYPLSPTMAQVRNEGQQLQSPSDPPQGGVNPEAGHRVIDQEPLMDPLQAESRSGTWREEGGEEWK